jgi:hypothetical protein
VDSSLYAWLVDVLLAGLFGLLLYTIKSHINDDSQAHLRIARELKDHADMKDGDLEKRIARIENYLNGKLMSK